MEFRERLYQLRKGRGISQEELAHTVGVSRQAVQKWEAGAATPDLGNLSALADYFVVSLDYLVRGIEPEKPAAPSPQQAVIQNYYTGWSYEFRSRRTLLGLPLVHINLVTAAVSGQGVIAIGNVATGLIAMEVFPPAC
ncbi:MAG: helix-turn-helix domain-containing protein [Flavonifractor plautii]